MFQTTNQMIFSCHIWLAGSRVPSCLFFVQDSYTSRPYSVMIYNFCSILARAGCFLAPCAASKEPSTLDNLGKVWMRLLKAAHLSENCATFTGQQPAFTFPPHMSQYNRCRISTRDHETPVNAHSTTAHGSCHDDHCQDMTDSIT